MRAVRGVLVVVRALAAVLVDRLRYSRGQRVQPNPQRRDEREPARERDRAAASLPSVAETQPVTLGASLAAAVAAPSSAEVGSGALQDFAASPAGDELSLDADAARSAERGLINDVAHVAAATSDWRVERESPAGPGVNRLSDTLATTGEPSHEQAPAHEEASQTEERAVAPLSTGVNGGGSDVKARSSAGDIEANANNSGATETGELPVNASAMLVGDRSELIPLALEQVERGGRSLESPQRVTASDRSPSEWLAQDTRRDSDGTEVATTGEIKSSVQASEDGVAQVLDGLYVAVVAPPGRDEVVQDEVLQADSDDERHVQPRALAAGVGDSTPAIVQRSKRPQYRPSVQAPPIRSVTRRNTEKASNVERALRIELRLRIEHGGFCTLTLLPRRDVTMPDGLSVIVEGAPHGLVALQDEWYQDVFRDDLGELMRRGMEWEGRRQSGELVRWSLSGREIFVLARHNQLSGFVTTPRLVLGESHVVLCANHRISDVTSCLKACGCAAPVQFDESAGAPSGWSGFRDVVPKVSVKPSATGDILDALCPQPEVEIVLSGGIRLERSAWLVGFPPRVRLHGDAAAAGDVWIDGQLASIDPNDGAYVAAHWDRHGEHQVWCAGKSASYSVANGDEDWQAWDAYRWSFGEVETGVANNRPSICGILTLPPATNRAATSEGARAGVVVPATNPVLLGSVPGQIYTASTRDDLHARTCAAFPPFDPIWALPLTPLQSDKRIARVLVVGALAAPANSGAGRNANRWSDAIIAASRKGLLTEPQSPDVTAAWEHYKQIARALRRRFR